MNFLYRMPNRIVLISNCSKIKYIHVMQRILLALMKIFLLCNCHILKKLLKTSYDFFTFIPVKIVSADNNIKENKKKKKETLKEFTLTLFSKIISIR